MNFFKNSLPFLPQRLEEVKTEQEQLLARRSYAVSQVMEFQVLLR